MASAPLFLPGSIFFLTLVSGILLSSSSRPYPGLLFNLHKLIALGAVVFLAIQLSKIFKTMNLQTAMLSLLVLAGICILILFGSGAFMSAGKFSYPGLLMAHRVSSILAALAIGVVIYLLSRVVAS